jgi:hypothetical protein
LLIKWYVLNDTTTLDAGAGFTSYSWSTGATTQSIIAGAGNYYVDLGFNGCVYRQYVKITTAESPLFLKLRFQDIMLLLPLPEELLHINIH